MLPVMGVVAVAASTAGAVVTLLARAWPAAHLAAPQVEPTTIAHGGPAPSAPGTGPPLPDRSEATTGLALTVAAAAIALGAVGGRRAAADGPAQPRLRPLGSDRGALGCSPCHRGLDPPAPGHLAAGRHARHDPGRRGGRDRRAAAHPVPVRDRLPGARRRRPEPARQRHQGAGGSCSPAPQPAHRVRRVVVPVRPLDRRGSHVRRPRPAPQPAAVTDDRGPCWPEQPSPSPRPWPRPGCCSASTGSPTSWPGSRSGWAWFALCSIAFGGRLLRFGTPVVIADGGRSGPRPAPGSTSFHVGVARCGSSLSGDEVRHGSRRRRIRLVAAVPSRRRRRRGSGSPDVSGRRFAELLVGTSGWSYDDWAGSFYPHGLARSRWLEHYASASPPSRSTPPSTAWPQPRRRSGGARRYRTGSASRRRAAATSPT